MLSARFDPAAGELRLAAGTIEALGRVASGPDPAAAEIEVLEALGVVDNGRVHPAVAPMADVIGRPLVRVTLRGAPATASGMGAEAFEARVWLDAGFGVCARPVGRGLSDLVVAPPSATPVIVAGLVDLGPRPALGLAGAVVLPEPIVRALRQRAAAVEEVAAAAPVAWRAPLRALAGSGGRSWSVSATWIAGEGRVAGRELDVVDGGDAGLWLVQPVRERGGQLSRMRPVRSRDLWRELCALLPTEAELSAGLTTAGRSPLPA